MLFVSNEILEPLGLLSKLFDVLHKSHFCINILFIIKKNGSLILIYC